MPKSPALSDLPEVLTVREAAAFLRVSPNTVYRLCERGQLERTKLGGTVRIFRKSLERMAEGQ